MKSFFVLAILFCSVSLHISSEGLLTPKEQDCIIFNKELISLIDNINNEIDRLTSYKNKKGERKSTNLKTDAALLRFHSKYLCEKANAKLYEVAPIAEEQQTEDLKAKIQLIVTSIKTLEEISKNTDKNNTYRNLQAYKLVAKDFKKIVEEIAKVEKLNKEFNKMSQDFTNGFKQIGYHTSQKEVHVNKELIKKQLKNITNLEHKNMVQLLKNEISHVQEKRLQSTNDSNRTSTNITREKSSNEKHGKVTTVSQLYEMLTTDHKEDIMGNAVKTIMLVNLIEEMVPIRFLKKHLQEDIKKRKDYLEQINSHVKSEEVKARLSLYTVNDKGKIILTISSNAIDLATVKDFQSTIKNYLDNITIGDSANSEDFTKQLIITTENRTTENRTTENLQATKEQEYLRNEMSQISFYLSKKGQNLIKRALKGKITKHFNPDIDALNELNDIIAKVDNNYLQNAKKLSKAELLENLNRFFEKDNIDSLVQRIIIGGSALDNQAILKRQETIE